MIHTVTIKSHRAFDIDLFLQNFEISMVLEMEGYDDYNDYFYIYRPGHSTSMFLISYNRTDEISVSIDMLASYDDYRFFPYLLDSINIFLNGENLTIDGEKIYDIYNEDWAAESIGEEIAMLKSTLSVFPKYYQELPLKKGTYISLSQLKELGVNLYSSTPRIHGYIQYIIKNNIALFSSDDEFQMEQEKYIDYPEIEVDVPQHVSIGRVKSWQIDGSETWESYSREDVDLLVELSEKFIKSPESSKLPGVVMNDIGTIYQEGIGVETDGEKAIYWFNQAICHGDRLYAASNLGDLYRKGCGTVKPSLSKAFDAYMRSEDYYAMYRIGQAYEEGWIGLPNLDEAFKWYRKAARNGHHLAIKRLKKS